MRHVVIDVGNSRIRAALWQPGTDPTVAVPLTILGDWDTSAVAAAAADLAGDGDGGGRHAVVSVVPAATTALAEALPGTVVVDHRSALPFELGVDDPAAVGADRLANMAACAAAGLDDALVVDAGTATTFDVLRDGVFVGGAIAPGMAFAAEALGRAAARLEPVPFAPCELRAAADTAGAMAVGAWHAGRGGVDALIAGLLARYGPRPVFVTGGLGVHLQAAGRTWDPHLTLRGAAILAGFAD